MVTKTDIWSGTEQSRKSQAATSMVGCQATPLVCFIGTSSCGKTTLLEQVVRELKTRGARLAVVKHAHDGFDVDRPGKDSWRMARAGSDVVALCSPDGLAIFEPSASEPPIEQIAARFQDTVDIVLAEGFKQSHAPKIVVLGCDQTEEPFLYSGAAIARVRAHSSPSGSPRFDWGDILGVTELLLEMIGDGSASDPPPAHIDQPVLPAW